MKTSGFAVIKVSSFRGENATADRNGLDPLYYHPIAGEIPNRNVVAGTVASDQGFDEGGSYLAQWTIGESDPVYGPRVSFVNVTGKALGPMEIIETVNSPMFGGKAGSIFDIEKQTKVLPANNSSDTDENDAETKATKSRSRASAQKN